MEIAAFFIPTVSMTLQFPKKVKIKTFIALALPVQILLIKWAGNYPDFVEKYYSEGIYPIISQISRVILGWIPFSFGDIFYAAVFIWVVRYIIKNRNDIVKKPLLFLKDIVVFISVFFFAFHFLWGMNYYRKPIEERFGIGKEYEVSDLIVFTEYLATKTNEYQQKITGDTITAVKIPYTHKEIFDKTEEAYGHLKQIYPDLEYKRPSLKTSLFSLALTYMGYGGYLNPFTNEAQVNGRTPLFRIPTVSGHEVGHQLGFAAEGDTNFIGFLVTEQHPDPYFKYAAYHFALGYCISDLSRKDESASKEIIATLNTGVKNNFRELRNFWEQYQNPLEPVFKRVYSTFLKANNQLKGIDSYNDMVGYLISHHKKKQSVKEKVQ